MTSDLITRISKLEGPNRRLDHEMHILFFVPDNKKDTVEWNHFGSYSWWPSHDHVKIDKVPAYTASVDAAISLAERVLPGWNGDLDIGKPLADSGKMGCRIWTHESKYHNYVGEGFNPATALLIAILRAKEASKL